MRHVERVGLDGDETVAVGETGAVAEVCGHVVSHLSGLIAWPPDAAKMRGRLAVSGRELDSPGPTAPVVEADWVRLPD